MVCGVPVKGTLNAAGYQNMLQTLWEQFLLPDPFLFRRDCDQCTKRGPYRHGRQSVVWRNLTDLNPIEHLTNIGM